MNCPNCGHLIDEKFSLVEIVGGFMGEVDGAKGFGRSVGEQFRESSGHAKVAWGRLGRDIVIEASKERQRQEVIEEMHEDDDAVLAEFAIAKIESGDQEFTRRLYSALVRRKFELLEVSDD